MINDDAEEMIAALAPEIDRKCAEINRTRRERRRSGLFMLLCAAVVAIPTLFVYWGISLTGLVIPVVFTAAAFLLLSPILMNQQGGRTGEQI